jgi:hypothetical protein
MASDALGIHNMVIESGIVGTDARCGNLGNEIFTPGHGYVPSLCSICGHPVQDQAGSTMNCEERADIIPQIVDFHQWLRVKGSYALCQAYKYLAREKSF